MARTFRTACTTTRTTTLTTPCKSLLVRLAHAAICGALLSGGAWVTRARRLPHQAGAHHRPLLARRQRGHLGPHRRAKLTESLKQSFVIENRAGAGGLIGSEIVAKAPPDGYTLVISGVASHVVALALAKPPPFDAMRDFTHVALIGGPPIAVIINNGVPARDLKSFAVWAKAQGAPIPFGSPGVGTHGQLIAELMGKSLGVELIHAPYKGASLAVADLIAGQIKLASITLNTAGPQLRGGKARALAFTSRARIEDYPDVPTFTELGYPQLVASTWFSLSGPAKMPEEIAVKLNAEVRRALILPDVKERFRAEGIETADYDVPAFNHFVADEARRWTPIVRGSGAKAD